MTAKNRKQLKTTDYCRLIVKMEPFDIEAET